jgi:hypothetical protein
MRKWVGVVLLGWYLLLPYRSDVKPAAGQPDTSLPRWQRVGAYDSALGCELARQARMERDRALVMTGVCVVSDDSRASAEPGRTPGEESGGLLGPSGEQ